MESKEFQDLCKETVADYHNSRLDKSGETVEINSDDVYIVWYSKTLQNHKALLSTPVADGMYYELTYNGDKDELYFDAYKKWENQRISLKG